MARPRKTITIEEQIKKQEETVLKVKEKYDSEMMKLKDLYAKRNEEKKKELLKAVENSTKTYEEIMDYIRCMTLTPNVKPEVYKCLTEDNMKDIENYINAPMTATYISEDKHGRGNREIVTSELIYYWMISLQIPIEFQKWHLNRLITLIRVCNIKNAPPKKMGKRAIMNRNTALNAARRKRLNTRG